MPKICNQGDKATGMTIRIDEKSVFEVIERRKPRSVALNGPEALIPKLQDVADHIAEVFGIQVYIIGDTCWGSCDLNTHAADMLSADILFNIGHTIAIDTFGQKVVMIGAFDDISFDIIANKCARDLIAKYKTVSLVTDSQHLHQIDRVKRIFEDHGYNVIIGRGKGQLRDGQVFGCEFYPAYNVQKKVDAYIFLGQSMFHSASVAMSTEKPTIMLDPYFEEYNEVSQFAHLRAIELKKEFEKFGKKVQMIALTEITQERIQIFKGIDAFVQVACPRLGTDNHFNKPMLSVPQALSLLKLLRKEPIGDFLKIQHWL